MTSTSATPIGTATTFGPRRAELGHTEDPTALIPGHPDAVLTTADCLDTLGAALSDAGDGLRRVDTGGWTGAAADSFRALFNPEPGRWTTAGHALTTTGAAVRDYSTTLVWAQAQAREAIALWNQAQAQTERAKADHAELVRQAQATAAPGTVVSEIAFHDPGEATRAAARDLLDRARDQLDAAAQHTTGIVATGRDQAPPGPRWWQQAWRHLSEYRAGVHESLRGMGEYLWSISTVRMITDPVGYQQTVTTLTQAAAYAVHHPVDTAKAVVDWDTWQTNPARAAGRLGPDLALTLATGGTATAATRTAAAAKALTSLTRRPRPTAPGPTAPPPVTTSPISPGGPGGVVVVGDFGPRGHTTGPSPGPAAPVDQPPPARQPEDDLADYDQSLYGGHWYDPVDLGTDPADLPPRPTPDPPTPNPAPDPAPDPAPSAQSRPDPTTAYTGQPDFHATDADHHAYRDHHGPLTDADRQLLTDWRTAYPDLAPLADEELDALRQYLLDPHDIDHALRTGDPDQLRHHDATIREAVSALNHLPPYQGTVHHDLTIPEHELADFLDRHRSGTDIREPGFTTTHTHPPGGGNVHITIDTTTGRYLPHPGDPLTTPHQVLFPPGHEFTVTRVDVNPHTKEVAVTLIDAAAAS